MIENLFVSEIYRSYQGEGRFIGTPSIFLRLQFCPVGCIWCDTKFTWKFDPTKEMSDEEVIQRIERHKPVSHIVITGGEPMIQRKPLHRLLRRLVDYSFEIETSGAYYPLLPLYGVNHPHYNVSPKPPSAKTRIPTNSEAIEEFDARGADFKFVVKDLADLFWVKTFTREYQLRQSSVYLMPEGTTPTAIQEGLKWLVEAAKEELPEANITNRMHVQIWGNERCR